MKMYPDHRYPGKLIVIDGVGGAGKDTQANELARHLERTGHNLHMINFPRYDVEPYGPVIREYLATLDANKTPAKVGSIPYALDRLGAQAEIVEALKAGKIVVAIRYTASNAAYQGAKLNSSERQAYWDWLFEYEYGYNGIVREDTLIYLWLPTKSAMDQVERRLMQSGRIASDGRDGHEGSDLHVTTIADTYRDLAESLSYGHVLDCSDGDSVRSIQSIADDIYAIVARCIGTPPSRK